MVDGKRSKKVIYPSLPDGYYNYGNALFPVDIDFCRKTSGAVKSPSPNYKQKTCDDYPCVEKTLATTKTSATNAVLVLSTWNAANKPMVIGWNGKLGK